MPTENQIEFFVHFEGQRVPRLVKAAAKASLLSALTDAGIAITDEMHVFVGDCEQAAVADIDPNLNDLEDDHEPESLQKSLGDCDLGHPGQVHCVRCRRVRTTVQYNGTDRRRAFSPAASVATATKWAHRVFHVDRADAANFVLQLCGTKEAPSIETKLVQLVEKGQCELCFELVPRERIEGVK